MMPKTVRTMKIKKEKKNPRCFPKENIISPK